MDVGTRFWFSEHRNRRIEFPEDLEVWKSQILICENVIPELRIANLDFIPPYSGGIANLTSYAKFLHMPETIPAYEVRLAIPSL